MITVRKWPLEIWVAWRLQPAVIWTSHHIKLHRRDSTRAWLMHLKVIHFSCHKHNPKTLMKDCRFKESGRCGVNHKLHNNSLLRRHRKLIRITTQPTIWRWRQRRWRTKRPHIKLLKLQLRQPRRKTLKKKNLRLLCSLVLGQVMLTRVKSQKRVMKIAKRKRRRRIKRRNKKKRLNKKLNLNLNLSRWI